MKIQTIDIRNFRGITSLTYSPGGESVVIAEMVRTGQLTSEGNLTERDVASMVFLAYTSEEMLAELRLRKALDQPGDVAVTGRDLAPLKNIE